MSNPCLMPNCKSTACSICSYYKPKLFGISVPRWIGNIGFRVENWLLRKDK